MNWAITWILLALVAGLMLEGLVRQERAYQLPFLGAVMTFAFILPQMPGVADDPFLPQGGYVKVCLMAILALLFLRLGWSEHRKPLALFNQTYSESRLLILAGILSAIGSVFYVRISHLPGEAVIGVQMTGAPVMYLFFARLLNYGLAIAVLCFARRVPAMHAVSHVTDWVVSVWMHMALFLVPVLIFAAVRGDATGRPASARQDTGHAGLYLVRGAP
jgi:hypothetical protein